MSFVLVSSQILRNRPSIINLIEPYLRRRFYQGSVNGSLPQVAAAASRASQGSVLGPIHIVIYVDDLTDNMTIDHLLYANDVKFIVHRK